MHDFKNLSKRGISLALALLMCVSLLPTTVFAAGLRGDSAIVGPGSGSIGKLPVDNGGADAGLNPVPNKPVTDGDGDAEPSLVGPKPIPTCFCGKVILPVEATPGSDTEHGVKAHYQCQGCGSRFESTTADRMAVKELSYFYDHDYTEFVSTTATCTEPGKDTKQCKVSGCEETKEFDADVLGHNYVDGACTRCFEKDPDAVCEHKDVTCVDNGNGTHKVVCNDCEETVAESETHTYESGVCVCGVEQASYRITVSYSRVTLDGWIKSESESFTFDDGYVGMDIHTGDVYFDHNEVIGLNRTYKGVNYALYWNWKQAEWDALYTLKAGVNDIGTVYYWHWDVDEDGDEVCDDGEHCLHGHDRVTHCGHNCGDPLCADLCTEHEWDNVVHTENNEHFNECTKCGDHRKVDHVYVGPSDAAYDQYRWQWKTAPNVGLSVRLYCKYDGCTVSGYPQILPSTIADGSLERDYGITDVTLEFKSSATCVTAGTSVGTVKFMLGGKQYTSSKTYDNVPATGEHDYSVVMGTTANCGKDGLKTMKCANCDATIEVEDKATGDHNFTGGTCQTKATCSVCGAVGTFGDHIWSEEWTIGQYSNKSTNGRKVSGHWHVCTVNGCSAVKEQEQHNYGDWKDNGNGGDTRECETCGYADVKNSHDMTGNGTVCTRCHRVEGVITRNYYDIGTDGEKQLVIGDHNGGFQFLGYVGDEVDSAKFAPDYISRISDPRTYEFESATFEKGEQIETFKDGGTYNIILVYVHKHVDTELVDGKCDECGKDCCEHEDMTHTKAVAATCTAEGNVEYWTCNVCGKLFADDKGETETTLADVTTAKLPHKLTLIHGYSATCTKTGVAKHWKCDVCSALFTYNDKTPTTEAGLVRKLKPDNHVGETEVRGAKEATCTEDGYTGNTYCLDCKKMIKAGEVIAATGHTEGDIVVENDVAATCTEDGSYDEVIYCTVCGDELSRETVTVEATGHAFGAWTRVTNPTETTMGLDARYCENENCNVSELRNVAVLDNGEVEIDDVETPLAGLPFDLDPQEELTRAHLIYILYWFEGEPEAAACTFTDVLADAYYYEALGWAEENGIVETYPDGTFEPEETVTREQMETILNLYYQYLEVDEEVELAGNPETKMLWGEAETILNDFFNVIIAMAD